MAKKDKKIKVVVELTEGYRERFTDACLDMLRKMERQGIEPERKEGKEC